GLAVLLLLAAGPAFSADPVKIGVVDLQKILETSNSGKAAQNELKAQRDKMQADMKQRGNEIQEIEGRMQREAMVMSKETREEKEREHRIKVSDFQALQRKYQGDLQEIERKLMGRLQTEITSLVSDIAKKEGYMLVISNIGVIYSLPSTDITERLIQELNSKSGKKAGQ
ncbi:MAG TPA: OmpH family outer membrane protein, partial [Desulfobacterales bacterium]|nr:OmpH family outer membrane protein [Desulfobacterales bacterium]